MKSGVKKWQHSFARWLDEWKLAFSGILLATRSPRFLIPFALTFVILGTLLNLLSGSSAAFGLFWTTDWGNRLKILLDGFLGLFGVNQNFWDWALLFSITILQSILFGLVALVWQKKRRNKKAQVLAEAKNVDNLQNAGLVAGLAVLGSGCPTCGTTLLAPVIGAMFSTGGHAIASAVSGLLTVAAVILALFSIKHVGNDAYALIVSEKFQKTHPAHAAKAFPTSEQPQATRRPAESTKTNSTVETSTQPTSRKELS